MSVGHYEAVSACSRAVYEVWRALWFAKGTQNAAPWENASEEVRESVKEFCLGALCGRTPSKTRPYSEYLLGYNLTLQLYHALIQAEPNP